MHLLRQFAAVGTELAYHGDFDWGGIRIGNVVFDRLPARTWRFDAAAYRAVAGAQRGHRLRGSAVTASWDPDLQPAMEATGRAIEEEHVLDHLLTDLAH